MEEKTKMKALSFRQPWAELILQGRKSMDLRTYRTGHRGPLAIHASGTIEREACLQHELDPDALATGGLVGVVELVDVIPLSEADYNAHEAEHLCGRPYREPMFGWVLSNPRRLPQILPVRGRMSLFHVDLAAVSPGPDRKGLGKPSGSGGKPKQQATYITDALEEDPEKPFALHISASPGSSTSYALTLKQRIVERDRDRTGPETLVQPVMTTIVTLNGDNLRAVANHVLEALRDAGYRATDLSPDRREPFYLPEPAGVRLGLVFLAVRPLSKLQRVEAVSSGIRQMPLEEAYYWYSKCTATGTAERAQKALRVLLAVE
jgi:hypothetical protein